MHSTLAKGISAHLKALYPGLLLFSYLRSHGQGHIVRRKTLHLVLFMFVPLDHTRSSKTYYLELKIQIDSGCDFIPRFFVFVDVV